MKLQQTIVPNIKQFVSWFFCRWLKLGRYEVVPFFHISYPQETYDCNQQNEYSRSNADRKQYLRFRFHLSFRNRFLRRLHIIIVYILNDVITWRDRFWGAFKLFIFISETLVKIMVWIRTPIEFAGRRASESSALVFRTVISWNLKRFHQFSRSGEKVHIVDINIRSCSLKQTPALVIGKITEMLLFYTTIIFTRSLSVFRLYLVSLG